MIFVLKIVFRKRIVVDMRMLVIVNKVFGLIKVFMFLVLDICFYGRFIYYEGSER